MLRRVVRTTRGLLMAIGLLLLLWLPASWFYWAGVASPLLRTGVSSGNGGVKVALVFELPAEEYGPSAWAQRAPPRAMVGEEIWLLPQYEHVARPNIDMVVAELPLWLLAFICLAWPVTSFIVARRRHKARGFEVETKTPSEAPKVRAEREPGASPRETGGIQT